MERANVQTRTLSFELDELAVRAASNDDRIPVVISSDSLVEMPDGPEILVHSVEAVDLSRAPLPIIASHKGGQINVGIIDNISIGGGMMRGEARFGERTEAREYRTDVVNKIIRSVSVGYRRVRGKIRAADNVLVTSRWIPMHAAMIAEPGDMRAGFFRELDSLPALVIEEAQPAAPAAPSKELSNMDDGKAAAGAIAEVQVIDNGAQERLRIKTLHALGRVHKIDGDAVEGWVDNGTTAEEGATKVLEIIAERAKKGEKTSPAAIGLSPAEARRFSITRAINAVISKDWTKAEFEAEASRAVGQRLGRMSTEHTFYVPLEVQQRDLIVATATMGGNLVATELQSFIDILRNRSVVMTMGAFSMPGLVGNVAIPRQTAPGTAYWLATEATAITESQPVIGQLTLSPKNVGGYTEISRQLLLQSTPSAEFLVNSDLAKVIGLAVDAAAIAGPGTAGQPTGILNTSGIGTAAPGTGTNLSYADMIRFQTTVAASNAFMPGFGYVTTPTVAGFLMGKPRFTNSDTPIWGGNILDGQVVGARAMTSNQIGSGTMLAGDFSQVVIAQWGVLEIETNPYANFPAGIVGVRAFYTVDVGVRYAAAFALGTGFVGP